MASRSVWTNCTRSAESVDEIEGGNERLLELLKLFKPPSSSNDAQNGNFRLQSEATGQVIPAACTVDPHKGSYHYSSMHLDSPSAFRTNFLPPIGVFWDIENCQVPKGRSAMAVTTVIRDRFFTGYKEAEFIVVCDVQKESKHIIQELNDAQVNLIHVAATCKNAADEKLRQSIRRFADIHGSPAAIILISGDINFAADLSDLRHRKKMHVILLHKENTSEALILCANEHYDFTNLLQPLPSRTPAKSESHDLLVCNLPDDKDATVIKRRLKQLSNNCGGRVVQVQSSGALVRFCSKETADRALKRMHGEYVFDSKIIVKYVKEKELLSTSKTRENTAQREHTLSESEVASETSKKMYGSSTSVAGARSLPVTPHYHSGGSPVIGTYSNWNGMHCGPPGMYQPPTSFAGRSYSSNDGTRNYSEHSRNQSPLMWQISSQQQQYNRYWDEHYRVDRNKAVGKRVHVPQVREYTPTDASNFRTGKNPILGRNSSFPQPPEWNPPRPPWNISTPNGGACNQNYNKHRSPSPMFMSQGRDVHHWNGQSHNTNSSRTDTRTPSPYDISAMNNIPQQPSRSSPYDAESEEVENFFNPINSRNGNASMTGAYTPIELQVTNLDQNIDPKDMKRILSSVFMEHVMVLQTSVFMQSDGNFAASVKVPSLPEAQYAISQLHRRKIGYKRILISYAHTGGPNPQIIRSQIVMLLQEVPSHKLPLFKFREMYESRFMISLSISELYKMKDVCVITDDPSGRMVALNPDHRNTPSPCFNTTLDGQSFELPYCTIHFHKPGNDKGWAEQEMASLPNVKISLKILGARLQQMLSTHSGNLPLPRLQLIDGAPDLMMPCHNPLLNILKSYLSLPNCYEAEFKEQLEIDENGVPLEHLVSCLPTVELKQGLGSVKHVVWVGTKIHDESHEENKCVSPPLVNQLTLFSRELVDLLKTAPHCQLSFNRFIPAYHHHFGRQCRVADYGFTKLIDLLEALSHTVQVMGEGNKRVVTLSHRAQVRRFTSDLLRVLKAQASKQVSLSEFPTVYARVIGKPWDVADYGVCEIDDILGEVSENTVVVTVNGENDRMIAIPKREQTPEEVERTKQVALQVVELLRHAPQQRMLFNKFVPSYHHHFGHQCRVSDYGFTKLIELFEAIPHVVKIDEIPGGERRISLTEKEGLRVLSEQIAKLIAKSKGYLSVANVSQAFLQQFGYVLRPELFDCTSMLQLMEKLSSSVKIVKSKNGPVIVSLDKSHLQHLGLECRRVLMDDPNHQLPVKEFQRLYSQYYCKTCDMDKLERDLDRYVQFITVNNEPYIKLTPLQSFACNLYHVLMQYQGTLNTSQFEGAYLRIIGSHCRPAQYGFPTLTALLQALPCTVITKDNRHKKKNIHLCKKLAIAGIPLPSSYTSTSPYRDTDSSNDSVESETSSFVTASSSSSTTNDNRIKWNNSLEPHNELWDKKSKHWAAVPLSETQQKWPVLESGADSFFRSLSRTVSQPRELPQPSTKLDSPEDDKNNQWKSSIWSTPPKYTDMQYGNVDSANVEVHLPPFTVVPMESASDLLSPMKNLLSAAPNPLSPYFSNRSPPVVAPHPSELPLPSLSLTPKKNSAEGKETSEGHPPISPNKLANESIIGDISIDSDERVDTTPTKRSFGGKRRLAAQFNQLSLDS